MITISDEKNRVILNELLLLIGLLLFLIGDLILLGIVIVLILTFKLLIELNLYYKFIKGK